LPVVARGLGLHIGVARVEAVDVVLHVGLLGVVWGGWLNNMYTYYM
jgi:hypothetical protein